MRLLPLSHKLSLDLFGADPTARVGDDRVPLEDTKYHEILCFLAAQGGKADLGRLCQAIERADDQGTKRSVRQLLRGRTPAAIWQALGLAPIETEATYVVAEGKIAFLREVSCDLMEFWNEGKAALELWDPQKSRELVERYERFAQKGGLLEGAVLGAQWEDRWLREARRRIAWLARELGRLSAPDPSPQAGPPREDPELARRCAQETEEAKTVLDALAILPDACSIETLQDVTGRADLAQTLDGLLDRGLVEIDFFYDQPRYSLHAHLSRSAVVEGRQKRLDLCRDRHRDHFLKVVQRCARKLAAPKSPTYRDELRREYAHIRAAIEWSLHQSDLKSLVFCYCLQNLWRGEPDREGSLQYCEGIIDRRPNPEASSVALARSFKCAGVLAHHLGEYERARGHYLASLERWDKLGAGRYEKGIVDARSDLALLYLEQAAVGSDDYTKAGPMLEDVYKKRKIESKKAAEALASKRGGLDPHATESERGVKALERRLHDRRIDEANCLFNLAVYHYYDGEHRKRGHTKTRTYLSRCLRICRRPDVGHREGQALCALVLGKCDLSESEYDEAFRQLRSSLAVFAEIDETLGQVDGLETLAYLGAATGRPKLAARLLAQSDRQRDDQGYPRTAREKAEHDKYIVPMITRYGPENYNSWYATPGFGGFQEAVQYVVGRERLDSETT